LSRAPSSQSTLQAFSPVKRTLNIGRHVLPNAVVLAPMAGVTDLPMRELCLELGAGLTIGEMVTADLSLNETRKTRHRRQVSPLEQPRSVQLVGSEPRVLAEAAKHYVDTGADIIDINMGCPAKKVCRKAAGSALLADEALVGAILDAVVGAVDVPVTLKIRTGVNPESKNAIYVARIAEQAGVQLLTIHGRTRADRFKGSAEYDTIAAVVDAISIPVLANGDIDSTHKARRVLAHTGAAGVMIGRAAQGKLWLPGLIARQLGGEQCSAPSIGQQLHLLQRHVNALHQFYDDYLGVRIARKHVGWCLDGLVLSAFSRPGPAEQTQPDLALTDLAQRDLEQRDLALKAWKKRFNQLERAHDQLDYLEALHHLAPELLAFNQQAQEETASLRALPTSYLTSGDLAA